MIEHEIGVIVGSLRAGSFNGQMADAVARLAPAHFAFKRLPIGHLPPYSQDDDADQAVAVRELKAAVKACSGIVFVTPEYNRSVPGVLKNAIDHASRPYGDNAWAGKPAAIMGVSIGAPGTSMAQQHLRNVLAYLDMPTLANPRCSYRQRTDCSTKRGTSASKVGTLLLLGWQASSAG